MRFVRLFAIGASFGLALALVLVLLWPSAGFGLPILFLIVAAEVCGILAVGLRGDRGGRGPGPGA